MALTAEACHLPEYCSLSMLPNETSDREESMRWLPNSQEMPVDNCAGLQLSSLEERCRARKLGGMLVAETSMGSRIGAGLTVRQLDLDPPVATRACRRVKNRIRFFNGVEQRCTGLLPASDASVDSNPKLPTRVASKGVGEKRSREWDSALLWHRLLLHSAELPSATGVVATQSSQSRCKHSKLSVHSRIFGRWLRGVCVGLFAFRFRLTVRSNRTHHYSSLVYRYWVRRCSNGRVAWNQGSGVPEAEASGLPKGQTVHCRVRCVCSGLLALQPRTVPL